MNSCPCCFIAARQLSWCNHLNKSVWNVNYYCTPYTNTCAFYHEGHERHLSLYLGMRLEHHWHVGVLEDSSTEGLFTLDTQCALNQIEPGLSAFTLNAHSPNPDPIRINSNPLPEVVSIRIELDRAIAPCAWGPRRAWAWHARSPTVSMLLRAAHCVPRICSTREAVWWLAEVKIRRGRHGSCVEVWITCTREFGSAQCSVDANHAIDAHWIRIEFALGNSVTEPVWIRIQCEQALRVGLGKSQVYTLDTLILCFHSCCCLACPVEKSNLLWKDWSFHFGSLTKGVKIGKSCCNYPGGKVRVISLAFV